jgi:hypothetical protein
VLTFKYEEADMREDSHRAFSSCGRMES